MSYDPKAHAAELVREIKAVMPPDSLVVRRLEANFQKLAEELETLRAAKSFAALDSDLEADWRSKVNLTAREMDVLGAIVGAGKRGISQAGIMTVAYGSAADFRCNENAPVQIWRIRQKFMAARLADPIETLRGRGYRVSTFPRTDAEMGQVAA